MTIMCRHASQAQMQLLETNRLIMMHKSNSTQYHLTPGTHLIALLVNLKHKQDPATLVNKFRFHFVGSFSINLISHGNDVVKNLLNCSFTENG